MVVGHAGGVGAVYLDGQIWTDCLDEYTLRFGPSVYTRVAFAWFLSKRLPCLGDRHRRPRIGCRQAASQAFPPMFSPAGVTPLSIDWMRQSHFQLRYDGRPPTDICCLSHTTIRVANGHVKRPETSCTQMREAMQGSGLKPIGPSDRRCQCALRAVLRSVSQAGQGLNSC